MKILIVTYGSRGDVQPYVALARGLQLAGHQVVIGTSERFRDFVVDHGLEYGYMSDGLLAIIDTDNGKEMIENTTSIFHVIKQNLKLSRQIRPLQKKQMRETWDIAESVQPDIILYHPKIAAAPHIAEKVGIPCVLATPIPMFVPTSERPFIVFPGLNLGGWYNRFSYKLITTLTALFLGKYIKSFRKSVGLAPLRKFDFLKTGDGAAIPVLHAMSRAVFTRPADWPENAHITGYWFLDQHSDWRPPLKLQAFLDGGAPPVYIGFGSMAGRNPERLANIVIEALQLTGQRGIIATGWGGLRPRDLPGSILQIENAPHDWLFPFVSAVVHHGGAGTTAAALRAGKPSFIVPFFGDQPFWGRLVHSIGAGPKPIPQKKLSVEKLATAITNIMTDPVMQEQAADLGKNIGREDGVGGAVALIEKMMEDRQPGKEVDVGDSPT